MESTSEAQYAALKGRKYDSDKVRAAQLLSDFSLALKAVCEVGEMGAKKYALHNWPLVDDGLNRYQDAQMRHMLNRWEGEIYDPESQYLHAAHEAWNALAALQIMISGGLPLKRVVVKSEGTF